MGAYKDLTNQKFGKLVCEKDVGRTKNGNVLWKCKCECGNYTVVNSSSLKTGNTKSCGCILNKRLENFGELQKKHGMSDTKIYKVWSSMKQRCLNENDKAYKNYGGRGITVCNEWHEFEPFYEWAVNNGYKEGLTLERVDNDGDYCPKNCTWITKSKQSSNTRNCIELTYKGKTKIMKEWAEELNIPYSVLQHRIYRGWDTEKALSTPIKPSNRRHCKLIEYKGEKKSIAEWARELGIKYGTLHSRLYAGWSIEDAFNKPLE
jgi:hypothetical protein